MADKQIKSLKDLLLPANHDLLQRLLLPERDQVFHRQMLDQNRNLCAAFGVPREFFGEAPRSDADVKVTTEWIIVHDHPEYRL